MKKKIITVVMIMVLSFVLCGCMSYEQNIIIKDDGSASMEISFMINKDALDQLSAMNGETPNDTLGSDEYTVVNIDGVNYYKVSESVDFENVDLMNVAFKNNDSGMHGFYASKDSVRFAYSASDDSVYQEVDDKQMDSTNDIGSILEYKFNITMPNEIIKTSKNAVISEDGKTATFNITGDDIESVKEIMVSTKEEKTAPKITGVKNKGVYKKSVRVKATDKSGIKEAKYKFNDGKYYKFNYVNGKKFTKKGKYTVYATDLYGNKRVVKFTIK